ncbi:hypothetical protein SSX86_030792 [Deinandra increscens subsp. villosa]|uniref:SWIM-type domain-containing protein n=1 Tax=Deinandra increscens subsp. villosa TaxID=3103831 RepID=A0AAP0CAA1_9ASTR
MSDTSDSEDGLFVRRALSKKDVEEIYASGYDNLFTIKLHHGGNFSKFPGRCYQGGKIDHVDMIDIDKFSVHDMDTVMLRLGYKEAEPIYYHFLEPGKDLDYGLQPLSCDTDVLKLNKYVPPHTLICVYTEHGRSSVPIITSSSVRIVEVVGEKEARIEEMEFDELFSYDKQLDGDGQCKAIVHYAQSYEVPDEVAEQVAKDVVNVEIYNDEVANDQVDNDEGSDDQVEDDEGSDDSDYVQDDDNGMDDYDVDMRDFRINVDPDVEELLESDNDNEDEVLDNENFLQQRQMDVDEGRNLFYLGQLFGTKEECKSLIRAHAVETRRDIRVVKDEDDRVRAVCKGGFGEKNSAKCDKDKGKGVMLDKDKGKGLMKDKDKGKGVMLNKDKNIGGRGKKTNPHQFQCPWVLLLSKVGESWMVRTLILEHKCLPVRKSYACTSTYLSKKLVEQVAENPEIPVKAVQEQLQRELQLRISKMKAFRAKALAKKEVYGDYIAQYALLRDYVNELKSKNPGTTVKIEVEPTVDPDISTRRFKRIYICLGALKNGFKAIGRELLGLDGAFMKGPFPGQILSAVGIDPNNSIYPVCYAIVEAESLSSWTWFLECLGEDLELTERSDFTFVSDRQKDLIPAMAKDAHEWLSKIPPEHWSRSHFSGRALSDVLLNNMCEVFNGKICEGRDKPIYSALEFIREYLMRRIVTALKAIEKSDGLLTPTTTKLFEKIKNEASGYRASWNGGELYQVSWNGGPSSEQYVVNLDEKTCACRRWEITGIPCKHAVAAIWIKARNSEDVGHLESWVNPVYTMERWKQVYSFRINPINGRTLWVNSDVPTTLTPPTHHIPVGRPKKARKRSVGEMEDQNNTGRLSKKHTVITCSKCGNKGHNQRTCKGQSQPKVPSQVQEAANGEAATNHGSHGEAATNQGPHGGAANYQGPHGGASNFQKSQASNGQGSQRLPKKNTCSKCGGKGHNQRTCKSQGK